MNIIITGGNGFLGSIIAGRLRPAHQVVTVGRGSTNDVVCDLAGSIPVLPASDMVVHAAGKAHAVPGNESEAKEIFRVNVTGTSNLLRALEKNPPQTLVFISSVAVYGCDHGELIPESHPLNATDPYGRSKIEAEALVMEWGGRLNKQVVVLRLPLIVGPAAPGNLGAMTRAIRGGYYFRIGEGKARRSVVRAEDVAGLIPKLHGNSGIYNLTDGVNPMVSEIENYVAQSMKKSIRSIPPRVASWLAKAGDFIPAFPINSRKWNKLTQSLTFSDNLARQQLGWSPAPFYMDFLIG